MSIDEFRPDCSHCRKPTHVVTLRIGTLDSDKWCLQWNCTYCGNIWGDVPFNTRSPDEWVEDRACDD